MPTDDHRLERLSNLDLVNGCPRLAGESAHTIIERHAHFSQVLHNLMRYRLIPQTLKNRLQTISIGKLSASRTQLTRIGLVYEKLPSCPSNLKLSGWRWITRLGGLP